MNTDRIIGADFSRYQGRVDAEACAAVGIRFAWYKASHGSSPDPLFARNWAVSRGVYQMGRGAYIWLTTNDPIVQAESVVSRLEATGDIGELFTAVDNEQVSALRDEALALHALKCLRRIRQLGGNAVHYSGKWFLDQYIGSKVSTELLDELVSFPYWHAEYPRLVLANRRACGLTTPTIPSPHLPRIYLERGIEQAVQQFDGDGGCVLPDDHDADFDEATEAGMRLVTRESHRVTWPAPPIVDADDGTAATPLRAGEGEQEPELTP